LFVLCSANALIGGDAQPAAAQCSVRNPRWHLVSNSKDGAKRWELYDVKADPGEQTDLATQHPDVVKEMDAAYDKWWTETLPLLEN
jgi:arylsulfatase A-like enzyme